MAACKFISILTGSVYTQSQSMQHFSILKKHEHFAAYFFVLAVIVVLSRTLPIIIHPAAEILMFSLPFILKDGAMGLNWDTKRALIGLVISVAILTVYVLALGILFKDKGLPVDVVDLIKSDRIITIAVYMLVVSIAEEVFFRGYMQERIGMGVGGVVIVSLLFAVGHFVTALFGAGVGIVAALMALLTFFPSLVMGYLYLKMKTLWPSIFFHFLSNMAFVITGGL